MGDVDLDPLASLHVIALVRGEAEGIDRSRDPGRFVDGFARRDPLLDDFVFHGVGGDIFRKDRCVAEMDRGGDRPEREANGIQPGCHDDQDSKELQHSPELR